MIALGWFTLAFALGTTAGVILGSMFRDRTHADHALERARKLERAHRHWHADHGNHNIGLWTTTVRYPGSGDACYLCHLQENGRGVLHG